MKQYLDTLKDILENGTLIKNDRSGTGTISLIGTNERYDLSKGEFPLVTTRKISLKNTINELIWFISGDSNCKFLQENKVPFWDKWTESKSNSIGPMYPTLWRECPVVVKDIVNYNENFSIYSYNVNTLDQLANLIYGLLLDIKDNKFSRRHYLSNINLGMKPNELLSPTDNVINGNMALDTCHQLFYLSLRPLTEEQQQLSIEYQLRANKEFNIDKEVKPYKYGLTGMLQMRSNDVTVGKPHNIAQYALLTIIIANALGVLPLEYIHSVNDAHVYLSHVEQAKEQLTRTPFTSPTMIVNPDIKVETILHYGLNTDMFVLEDYQCHPAIKYSLEG